MDQVPYYHLFSWDFNFANLEKEYFAGLKFCDFEELLFFKVFKFRKSSSWCSFSLTSISVFYLTITEQKRNKQLAELFITENYREPDADGKFEDCTEEVLQELIQQDESDDEE